MPDENTKPPSDPGENPLPPTYTFALKRRTEAEQAAYWEGFLAGLRAALHGVQSAIDRFELTRTLERQEQRTRDN